MGDSAPILKVGLTGGIASGKTTVAGFLSELGAFVVDADAISREIMEPGGSAYDGVVDRFGREILDKQGRIVRPLLAQVVFNDRAGLDELNAIVHPKVRAEAERRFEECAAQGRSRLAVFDAALLVETGAYRSFHRLVVVRCSEETQLDRLMDREGMEEQEARARIDAQASLEDKLDVADYVIDTDTTLEETRQLTEETHARLLDDYAAEFTRG